MPAENINLTAKWKINQYTITFDTNGGTNIESITQDYNSKIEVPQDPTRMGYTFIGWSKAIPSTMPAENINITAKWKINQYTITFDTNGGTEINDIICDYGDNIIFDVIPQKEHYVFVNWDQEIPVTMPARNIKLTAQWIEKEYTLTVLHNSEFFHSQKIKHGHNIDIDLNGKNIKDYYSATFYNEDNTLFNLEIMPTYDITIYVFFNDISTLYDVNGNSINKYIGTATKIVIPTNYYLNKQKIDITSIRAYAFEDCEFLTSIQISKSIINISNNAFYFCNNLNFYCEIASQPSGWNSNWNYSCGSVYWGVNENNLLNIDGLKYFLDSKLFTAIVVEYIGNSEEIEIPETIIHNNEEYSVTSIEYTTFQNCGNITSITIPNSVTSIEYATFSGCSSLIKITIPFVGNKLDETSNTHFGYIFGAYSKFSNSEFVPETLQKVIILGGNSIGSRAFYECSNLISIELSESITTIGEYAFYECSSLTNVIIPESVESIGQYAFYNCSSLTNVIIPESVESIGQYAFYNCSSLTNVIIPESVESIGDSAFQNCTSLTNVIIPESVESIGDSAFSNCTSLANVIIPESVESIGQYAFWYCSSLTNITIPFVGNTLNGTTNTHFGYIFGASAENLNSYYVPETLQKVIILGGNSIGSRAFYECSNLISIELSESITTIGEYAFYECSSLTNVIIPESVESIGQYAFKNCSHLTIYCEIKSQPSEWASNWNYSNCPVVWGIKL